LPGIQAKHDVEGTLARQGVDLIRCARIAALATHAYSLQGARARDLGHGTERLVGEVLAYSELQDPSNVVRGACRGAAG
jgi:hypothetical protein